MKPVPLPARQRILNAGTILFCEKGYSGCSVREICAAAETGINMIHHYFGNKQGLYDEILAGFTEQVWAVPARIISHEPRNQEHLISLLEIFAAETFEALIAHHTLYELVVRERMIFSTFRETAAQMTRFIENAQNAGFIRKEIDPSQIIGLLLDRLGNQVLFAGWIMENTGEDVLNDKNYRKTWLHKNLDLIFNGMITRA